MKFSDFVKTEAINADLKASNKEGAIRELVTTLVDSGPVSYTHLTLPTIYSV